MLYFARLKATIDILDRIDTSRIPMDLTMGDYLGYRRYIGSKDRADIAERVYGVVRHTARIKWALAEAGANDTTSRLRVLTFLKMVEGKFGEALEFDGSKYAPEPLTNDERKIISALPADFSSAPDIVQGECPPEYADTLKKVFGDKLVEECSAMCHGATLDLRVNLATRTREAVQESLKQNGVDTDVTPYSPWGLRVKGKVFLSNTQAFRGGHIEIQDEGSQLIAVACDVKPGMQVLDYCAGGGGKTLALASAMRVKGRIVAMDLEEARLAKAKTRFKRAKVSDIIETRPISDEKNRKWLRRQKETFDVVLTDVPCSGTGTWRRNPDMRWRVYGPSLDELVATQADILERVAGTVKVGGRLVYATCSLLADENENQIEKFLANHPEYELKDLKNIWPEGCQVPCDGKFMRLTPLRHNTDGFFAAVMVKKS